MGFVVSAHDTQVPLDQERISAGRSSAQELELGVCLPLKSSWDPDSYSLQAPAGGRCGGTSPWAYHTGKHRDSACRWKALPQGVSTEGALNSCSRNAFPAGVCHLFLDKFLELGRRVRCAWLVYSFHMFEVMAVNRAEGKKFKATE